jgi:hypothetical protein
MTTHRIFAALAFASVAACSATQPGSESSTAADTTPPPPAEHFTWPVPDHWAPETIPFPLDFAPTLPYAGVLELRFMPKFFTPGATTYFSYDYVWQIDGSVTMTADSLQHDMTTYYSGLSKSADPDHFDPSVHNASFAVVDANQPTHFRGTIHTTDGFNKSIPLTLNADVTTSTCGDKTIALFTISPNPFDDATWQTLLAERAAFACAN